MQYVVTALSFAFFANCGEAAILVRHSTNSGKTRDKTISSPQHEEVSPTVFHGKRLDSSHDGAHTLNKQSAQQTPCVDSDERCSAWAKKGECAGNANYMLAHCELSCGVCGGEPGSIGPLAKGHIEPTSSGTAYGIHIKDASWTEHGWGALVLAVEGFIPYAIMMFIIAFVWEELGGNLPPQKERPNNGQDFSYGLFSLDHCFHGHMWICLCSFCCIPIRTADNLSKSSKEYSVPRPIISSFWLALAAMLGIQFFCTISGGLGWILCVATAVYFRQRIRRMYGLPNCTGKVLAWDCIYWCCCPCCAIAQETRQVQFVTGDPVQVVPASQYSSLPANQYSSLPASQYSQRSTQSVQFTTGTGQPVQFDPASQYSSLPAIQHSSFPTSQYNSLPASQYSSLPASQYFAHGGQYKA